MPPAVCDGIMFLFAISFKDYFNGLLETPTFDLLSLPPSPEWYKARTNETGRTFPCESEDDALAPRREGTISRLRRAKSLGP